MLAHTLSTECQLSIISRIWDYDCRMMRMTRLRAGLSNFFFQAEDGIRDYKVTGVQTCALPILLDGTVTAGWLTGKAVHVEFQVIACTQAADHTCFQGTIRVIKASQTDNDENDD